MITLHIVRRLTPLLCAAIVGAFVASCSGEPESAPPAETPAAPPEGIFGTAPAAAGGTPSVITLTPTSGSVPAPASRENPRMDQLGLAFNPGLLVVRTGETVTFTNSETIAHNVHVAFSDGDSTALEYDTDPNASVDLLMSREGGYEVSCELHPGMRAFIYVTSAPYAVFASNNGSYRVEDVPPGTYALSVWNVDPTRRSERTIEVTGPRTEVP